MSASAFECPSLASPLCFYETADNGWIAVNSTNNRTYKISDSTKLLLSLINGERSRDEIISNYNKQSDVTINAELYESLCHTLAQNGLLASDLPQKKGKLSKIFFRIEIFKPHIIHRIANPIRFLFNPYIFYPFFIVSILTLVCFVIFGAASKNIQLQYDFGLYCVCLIASYLLHIFHEFGHAAASEYLGSKSNGIGFGLYLGFIPVFYSDQTLAWTLPSKKRFAINVGGLYFDFITASLFVVVGYFFDIQLFYLYPLIILSTCLINLNIFLKYDGYWILSDLLGIPNLQSEAHAALNNLIKSKKLPSKYSGLKRLALIVYGALSYIYIALFLIFAFICYAKPIILFPSKAISFVKNVLVGQYDVSAVNMADIFVPLLFYIIAVRKVIQLVRKRYKKVTIAA